MNDTITVGRTKISIFQHTNFEAAGVADIYVAGRLSASTTLQVLTLPPTQPTARVLMLVQKKKFQEHGRGENLFATIVVG